MARGGYCLPGGGACRADYHTKGAQWIKGIYFAGLRFPLSLSAEADAKELAAQGARGCRKNQPRLRNVQDFAGTFYRLSPPEN